jgi:hypothetical protein
MVVAPNVTPPASGLVRTPKRSQTNAARAMPLTPVTPAGRSKTETRGPPILNRLLSPRHVPTPSPQESPLRDYSHPPFTQDDPKWQFGYITNFEVITHHLRTVDGVSEELFSRYFFKCQYCSSIVRRDIHDCSRDGIPSNGLGGVASSSAGCGYEADDESLPVCDVIDLTAEEN